MAEVEAGDGRGREHGEILGQGDFPGIAAEHVEQDRLEAMVGAGGVAGRGTNALILLADQLLVGEMLFGIAPKALADLGVKDFREAFREAVRQSLQQDVGIIVVRFLEALEMRFEPVDPDRKAADPVLAFGIDEIREAHVRTALALLHLLAKEGNTGPVVARENEHVIALALAAPQADGGLRRDPALGDDLIEHRIGVVEQAPGAFADDLVVQDRGINAGQLPGAEEGSPVDRGLEIAQRPFADLVEAGADWRGRVARRVVGETVGAGLFERRELALAAAGASDAQRFIFVRRLRDERLALRVGYQRRGHADGAAGVEHVDHRAFVGGIDAQRRVRLACGRATDEERGLKTQALHLARDGHHLVERRRDQAAETDHVGIIVLGGVEDRLPRHHHAEVDHFEAVALQDDADDVLADVVNVALHGRHHDAALAGGDSVLFLFRLDEGDEVGDRLLHHPRGLHHLRQEHLARPEKVADDVHSVHQRALDDFDRARRGQAGFLGVFEDVGVDALDQRVRQPLGDRQRAPFRELLLLGGVGALEALGKRDQPVRRFLVAIENDVLNGFAKLGVDRVVDVELASVDDPHVHACRDGVVEEDAVHGPAYWLVAAKREA